MSAPVDAWGYTPPGEPPYGGAGGEERRMGAGAAMTTWQSGEVARGLPPRPASPGPMEGPGAPHAYAMAYTYGPEPTFLASTMSR
jgi:hypothetical protein